MRRNVDNIPCSLCGQYPNRAITVDALIIRSSKILLIKRRNEPFKKYWALPGGHLDWNEKIKHAVKREVKEETGLVVEKCCFFGIYDDPNRHPKQAIAIAFVVKAKGKMRAGSDALETKLFNINKLPQKVAFDHSKIILEFIRSSVSI